MEIVAPFLASVQRSHLDVELRLGFIHGQLLADELLYTFLLDRRSYKYFSSDYKVLRSWGLGGSIVAHELNSLYPPRAILNFHFYLKLRLLPRVELLYNLRLCMWRHQKFLTVPLIQDQSTNFKPLLKMNTQAQLLTWDQRSQPFHWDTEEPLTKLGWKNTKKHTHAPKTIEEVRSAHLYIRMSSAELLYWIWYMRTPGMWFCGGHLMVAEVDVTSDTLTRCWSERAWPPLTLDLMEVGMSEGPGSGSSLGSKCGDGLTTSSTGAVASPAALEAMQANFPES